MRRITEQRRGGRRPIAFLLLAGLAGLTRAEAGHESAFYPSFYPEAIHIQAADPPAAGRLLEQDTLHIFVGADPFAGRPVPAEIGSVVSFHSYLMMTFNPAGPGLEDGRSRCAAAGRFLEGLRGAEDGVLLHPYPVTPYHSDYVDHFDRIQAWQRAPYGISGGGRAPGERQLRIKTQGRWAERVARAHAAAAEGEWDASIEEVEAAGLVSPPALGLTPWPGPPWMKEGWFQAYRLLAGAIQDVARRQRIEAIARRLTDGTYVDAVEKVNLERGLVSLPTQGCERAVLGYTTRRTYFNDRYSGGVEHVTVDALEGPLSPIFPRTVKLKDFPWNGVLNLAVEVTPGPAAWSPIGGFTDPMGRLVWFAVGDPALFPAPANAHWVANRVTPTAVPSWPKPGTVPMPPDALLPAPGTGILQKVGPGKTARAVMVYQVPLSAYHDGTRMTVADLLYPYVLASRWAPPPPGLHPPDPAVAEATALLRRWLAGLKLVKTERVERAIADVKLEWQIPVIEVYLRHALLDPSQAASLAPPWSSLPWHLLALMEEAVARGAAAFSRAEAQRRGVPWLDLVRDANQQARLVATAEEWGRAGHVPEALKGLVTPEEAKERWAALRRFWERHRHLLITNGPYRLERWSPGAVELRVFRDPSYPLGIGTFDALALPPKAYITSLEPRRGALRVTVEMEKPVRAQRSYTRMRERLAKDATVGGYPVQALCRYLVVGTDGQVRQAGAAPQAGDGTFHLDLKRLPRGRYTVFTAVILNSNAVAPDVRAVPYQVTR